MTNNNKLPQRILFLDFPSLVVLSGIEHYGYQLGGSVIILALLMSLPEVIHSTNDASNRGISIKVSGTTGIVTHRP